MAFGQVGEKLRQRFLGYCNHTHFQTRGHEVQKCMFLLFVHLAYFSSDFDGVFAAY
jgi:hypothetical protein